MINRVLINCYDSTWSFKKHVKNIKNSDFLQFSELINWWQWELNLILNEAFDDTSYTKWDFIELILFNEKYKSWKLKYTWYIYLISRKFNIVDL